jgi:hypothetical protein
MLTGEELDVQSYYAPRSSTDDRPDYDKVSIGIQPMTITQALFNASESEVELPNPDDRPYALGRFVSAKADEDGFCVARSLSEARARVPAIPEQDMCTEATETPAVDVTYEFNNVRVYYTPSAIGTQFAADLTYTQDGCVARYRVAAVYPMVACGVSPPLEDAGAQDAAAVSDADIAEDDAGIAEDPDGGPADDAGPGAEECPPSEVPGAGPEPDDALCQGAGINPDFAVGCDPNTLMCALKNRPPSLK